MDDIAKKISEKKLADFQDFFKDLSQLLTSEQLVWLSGYLNGLTHAQPDVAEIVSSLEALHPGLRAEMADDQSDIDDDKKFTILYGSHTGNGHGIALDLKNKAERLGFHVNLKDMGEYKTRHLKKEKNLVIIVSTHGEGDPPITAEELHEFIHGPRAPELEGVHFAVLALGDKSYVNFCQTGKDFDHQLEELGATRLVDRVDCDVDFKTLSQQWIKTVLSAINPEMGDVALLDSIDSAGDDADTDELGYSAKNPYYAKVLSKVDLHAEGSLKETYHMELSLKGSGITYKPGDVCGVIAHNSAQCVGEVIAKLGLDPEVGVESNGVKTTLASSLKERELTVLTADVIKKHNAFAQSEVLDKLLKDSDKLSDYIYGRDLVDLLTEFPVQYTAQDLISITRPIPARLYSISSSLSAFEDEVHLLVCAVRYQSLGREKSGVASTFLADAVQEGDEVPIYIKPNKGFRLPKDPSKPVIMIGPGTGIAPFRAFMTERAEKGAPGKNWLIFGHQYFTTDFLYQTEMLQYLKQGVLNRMNVAFSRDQKDKLYVQHKIEEYSKAMFAWLEDGAYIYVCGDATRMAGDVYDAFINVVIQETGCSYDRASDYMKYVRRSRRYLEDVY